MIWLEMISIRTAGIIEAGKVFEICRQMLQSIADEKLLKLTVFSQHEICDRYQHPSPVEVRFRVWEHFGQRDEFGARRSRTDKPHVMD